MVHELHEGRDDDEDEPDRTQPLDVGRAEGVALQQEAASEPQVGQEEHKGKRERSSICFVVGSATRTSTPDQPRGSPPSGSGPTSTGDSSSATASSSPYSSESPWRATPTATDATATAPNTTATTNARVTAGSRW